MASPPTGTLTFLFTDIEGSTRLWQHDAQAMKAALARHDKLLALAIEERGGYVFKIVGDAFCAWRRTSSFPTHAPTTTRWSTGAGTIAYGAGWSRSTGSSRGRGTLVGSTSTVTPAGSRARNTRNSGTGRPRKEILRARATEFGSAGIAA